MAENHPDREKLENFARGELMIFEERRIEDHLRSGCPVCQRKIDDLLPTFELPLEIEEPAGAPWLVSDQEEASWQRIYARMEHRIAQMAREREAAPALVSELLRHPPKVRGDLARAERRFATVAVCEILIEKSFEEGFQDPATSVALSELAVRLASSLDPSRYGRSVVHDLQARAWGFLGNARRITWDLAGAEHALSLAHAILQEGSADPLEEAKILDLKASLLIDQGRFEKAADLLNAVIEIYRDLRDPHREGRALLSKGLVLGYAGLSEAAVETTREGLSRIDGALEPHLSLMGRHDLRW
jgi:tetratricopeptide (TPR) repeat protein